MLKRGDRGLKVRYVQEALITMGYAPGPADGIYGAMTSAAVALFQSENNLTATGTVDDKTARAITTLSTQADYTRPLSPTRVTKVGPMPTTPLMRVPYTEDKPFLGLPVKYWILGSVVFAGITLMFRRK